MIESEGSKRRAKISQLESSCCDQTTQTRLAPSTPIWGSQLSPLEPGTQCRFCQIPSLKWRMATSSLCPSKLSQTTQREPSGAAAIEGMSSWRDSWPTGDRGAGIGSGGGTKERAAPWSYQKEEGQSQKKYGSAEMFEHDSVPVAWTWGKGNKPGFRLQAGTPKTRGRQNEWYPILA